MCRQFLAIARLFSDNSDPGADRELAFSIHFDLPVEHGQMWFAIRSSPQLLESKGFMLELYPCERESSLSLS